MNNLSVYDMMICLENCHGVEEDYIIPATYSADGDPKKFEKVLNYFSGDRFQKFTDPGIPHCEDCQIPYLLKPDKFTLEIDLGNAAIGEIEDITRALERVIDHLSYRDMTEFVGHIQDRNGNSVGKWELK